MGRKTAAGAADDEQPTVKCDTCGRWAYLEETPFADLGEAGTDNAPFQCRGCQRVEALQAQIAECVAAVTKLASCEKCRQVRDKITIIEMRVQSLEEHLQQTPATGRSGEPAAEA